MTVLHQGSSPTPPGQPYFLLIEDDTEDEALAQRIIRKYRIANSIDWAKDGEEALKLLRERLTDAPSAPGRSQGESTQVLARSRPMETGGGSGTPLLPASDKSTRPADPAGPGRLADPRSSNGQGVRTRFRAPEMVLLDFGQPRSSALDVIRSMRAVPGMENVPVTVCCRLPEEEKVIRDAALHRTTCLSKPIGFFKLLECIQKMDMHWFVFSEKP